MCPHPKLPIHHAWRHPYFNSQLAAERIADAGVGIDFPWPPFFVNIAYAVELSLKAYVVHCGGSEKVCRERIGHDLFRAIDEAQARGFAGPNESVLALITRIAPYHRGHNFRYMTTSIDATSLPDAVECLALTNLHLVETANQLTDLLPSSPPNSVPVSELPVGQAGEDVAEMLTGSEAGRPSAKDAFLDDIARERARVLDTVAARSGQLERELEARFADDLRVKQRLSDFARANGLDRALTALWEEIRHYPAWSERDDFEEKWNTLRLSGISGAQEGDEKAVTFVHDGRRFTVVRREWTGESGTVYADFTLSEDHNEVFAINSAVEYDDYTNAYYTCNDVRAFKKRGAWAPMLLHFYSEIMISHNKSLAESEYLFADEIQDRFEQ